MKRYMFVYAGIPVEYQLERKDVKNINIRVNRQGDILVSAGRSVPLEQVKCFVEGKAEWIIRSLAEMEKYRQALPQEGIFDGKTVFLLGQPYTLKLHDSPKTGIAFTEDSVEFYTPYSNDTDQLKQDYLTFLKKIARQVFDTVLDQMLELMKEENIKKPELYIRNMRSRWGSCNYAKNRIGLNLQLIKADEACIEQVMVHELVHLKINNHGEDFYHMLEKYKPDWKERKNRLETQYQDGIF